MRCFYFSYHYKLPFGVYPYTFDMCTNKVYLLTYTYLFIRLVGLQVFAVQNFSRLCVKHYLSLTL